ncbi:MAG: S8 family serine peptidase [Bdellovibrionota bacterium]
MDVAKTLTLSVLLASSGAYASNTWIIRLKKESQTASAQSIGLSSISQTRDRLLAFKQSRLSRKKGLLLPRTNFLVTEDLSPGEVKELRDDPSVAYVEQDISWKTQDSAGDPSTWPSSFDQAAWLHDLMGFSSSSPDPYVTPDLSKARTIVAVIDTGSRSDHPFLSAALEPNLAELNKDAGIDDDNNGFVDDIYGANAITRSGSGTESNSSHGTHVAGIIKTIRDHAISEFPEAAQVSILPVRFIGDDGSGSTATAITALEYALARGASVVNASWGAKGNGAYSQALYDAFAKLYAADVFFAIAAGNADGTGANNNDAVPFFPANFNIPSLLSVASVTPSYNSALNRLVSLELSSFSNFGTATVQVAAPGDYSDGRGGSDGILSAYSGFGAWGNLYIKKQGTSMASPVVAGIAAVMRAVNPTLTGFETKELLVKSAHRYSSLSKIESSSLVHARDAILLAENSVSEGTHPRLPSTPVRLNSSPETSPAQHVGGCGTVTPFKPQGPFGGNSLGLLSAGYALMVLVRARRKKVRPLKGV